MLPDHEIAALLSPQEQEFINNAIEPIRFQIKSLLNRRDQLGEEQFLEAAFSFAMLHAVEWVNLNIYKVVTANNEALRRLLAANGLDLLDDIH